MKGRIKLIENKQKTDESNTTIYDVINKKGDELGEVYFDSEWKKIVFCGGIGAYFDVSCLKRLIELMEDLNY